VFEILGGYGGLSESVSLPLLAVNSKSDTELLICAVKIKDSSGIEDLGLTVEEYLRS
jgi:hypothetical protein